MPLSRSRDYQSIGEVLDGLRTDFPDITISKIRFLESEGLIAPERTASGYRKFYDPDVKRLRYILALQRDHFLPLRVIRQRLDAEMMNGADFSSAEPEPPRPGAAPAAPADLTGVQMNRSELAAAANLTPDEIAGLEDFGVLERRAGDGTYDENDLVLAKAARRFFDYGVEPRHLRMYKQFADREAAFFGQIVSPVTRRADPNAAQHASQSVRELMQLSRQVREATLRMTLKDLL